MYYGSYICWTRIFMVLLAVLVIFLKLQNSEDIEHGTYTNLSKSIKIKIDKLNRQQVVYNEELFGSLQNNNLVLLVQVHKRPQYLKYLINSLSRAAVIQQVLLIFSHDIFDDELNEIVRKIKFCKVMQIFFPYSIQIHPNRFPGKDPRDCPRNMDNERAIRIKCLGAEYPDKYGHYRESKYTQIKHHWWWKMNYVFNSLNVTATYDGLVVFLEEDHYVAEDFIHMLKVMHDKCKLVENCTFMGLGMLRRIKPGNIYKLSNMVQMSHSYTNLGLAFSRKTYFNTIRPCANHFCEYDDYNWDWSLSKMAITCQGSMWMLSSVPRVFHIGQCGTHKSGNKGCNISKILKSIHKTTKKMKFFPLFLELAKSVDKKRNLEENGGWGDKRDHELCNSMTKR